MSPPQHAHFMTSRRHKEEMLFLSLVFLAFEGTLFLFLLLLRCDAVYRGCCFQLSFSPVYDINLQIAISQQTVILVELDKITQEGFTGLFCCY
jgi:hypothetical protein